MAASRELIAFAYVHDAFSESGDIAAGLAPLFRPIVAAKAGSRFDPEEFAEAVTEYYGLPMHPKAAEFFAEKMVAQGLLEKETAGKFATLTYGAVEIADPLSVDDLDNVYQAFADFAGMRLRRHSMPVDAETVKQALNDYLRRTHFLDVDASNEYGGNVSLYERSDSAAVREVEVYEYLCSAFVEHLHEFDAALFHTLRRLVSGLLIAEVVLSLQVPTKTHALRGLTVYLDAPILLYLLDLSNEENIRHTKSLISHLRDNGVQIAIFRHHVDEARQSLSAVLSRVDGITDEKPFGPLSRRLIHDNELKKHAKTVSRDMEGYARNANVRIVDALDASAKGVKTNFSAEDEVWISNNIGDYENAQAKLNDAKAIAGVIRLRNGFDCRDLISAKHVFMTENGRLARMSFKHLRRQRFIREGVAAPPCVTSRFVAGVMWLTIGGQAGDALTESQLLANCARATIPSERLVENVRKHLASYRPDQVRYFEALMTDERAAHALMDQTLGDEEYVTENNILEIYEEVVRAAGDQVRREKDEEIASIERELVAERKRAENLTKKTEKLEEQAWLARSSQLQTVLWEGRKAERQVRIAVFIFCVLAALGISFPEAVAIVSGTEVSPALVDVWRVVGTVVLLAFGAAQFAFQTDYLPLSTARRYGRRVVRRRLGELPERIDLDEFPIDWKRWRVVSKATSTEADQPNSRAAESD